MCKDYCNLVVMSAKYYCIAENFEVSNFRGLASFSLTKKFSQFHF